MSGGSFAYLGIATDTEDVLAKRHELESMATFLIDLGYADDAASATHDIRLEIRRFHLRMDAMIRKVVPVWHAAEWWQSGDWGEDQFRKALADYRGEPAEAAPR